MEKVGFVGSYDKTDFIVQIAKILTVIGKKVIVIDTSLVQKAKYIIPVINPTKSYVTEFEQIDVAVGFENVEQINDYLGVDNIESLYDIALIDIDNIEAFDIFDMYNAKLDYFVTSFDLYSLKRGIEVLSNLKTLITIKKVLFTKVANQDEEDYLNFLTLNHKIKWASENIYFPLEIGDQSAIIENQRVAKIKFKNLSPQYKDGILYIVYEILGDVNINYLKKVLKNIEKGV